MPTCANPIFSHISPLKVSEARNGLAIVHLPEAVRRKPQLMAQMAKRYAEEHAEEGEEEDDDL